MLVLVLCARLCFKVVLPHREVASKPAKLFDVQKGGVKGFGVGGGCVHEDGSGVKKQKRNKTRIPQRIKQTHTHTIRAGDLPAMGWLGLGASGEATTGPIDGSLAAALAPSERQATPSEEQKKSTAWKISPMTGQDRGAEPRRAKSKATLPLPNNDPHRARTIRCAFSIIPINYSRRAPLPAEYTGPGQTSPGNGTGSVSMRQGGEKTGKGESWGRNGSAYLYPSFPAG